MLEASTYELMLCATLEGMQSDSLNYYQVLDVASDATQDCIFEAYKKAQQTFSLNNPEIFKIFSKDEAKAWVDLIEEAYSVIGFPNSRRTYDDELHAKVQPQLPSFEFSSDSTPETEKDKPVEVPEGFAQTKISVYEINPKMEEQIGKQEVFDGLFLKKVREYKKIDLTEFSTYTCIAIRHLYAIENNNFSVLPAPVFVRGYVIQYCRTLGLEEDKVVSSFMNLLKNV